MRVDRSLEARRSAGSTSAAPPQGADGGGIGYRLSKVKESEEKNQEKCEKRLYGRLFFYLSLGLWCFSVVYSSSFNLFYVGKICVRYSLQCTLSNCSTCLYLKVSSLRAANAPPFAPVAPLLCLIHRFRVLLGIIVYSAVVRQYFKSHSHPLVPQRSCFDATATKLKTRGFLPLCMCSGESFKKAPASILLQADKRGHNKWRIQSRGLSLSPC